MPASRNADSIVLSSEWIVRLRRASSTNWPDSSDFQIRVRVSPQEFLNALSSACRIVRTLHYCVASKRAEISASPGSGRGRVAPRLAVR